MVALLKELEPIFPTGWSINISLRKERNTPDSERTRLRFPFATETVALQSEC
jgi:hypothetical protein